MMYVQQELVAKRTEQMKKHVEYRESKSLEWADQKPRRLELRNCKSLHILTIATVIVHQSII
jgi:hypothetical protein